MMLESEGWIRAPMALTHTPHHIDQKQRHRRGLRSVLLLFSKRKRTASRGGGLYWWRLGWVERAFTGARGVGSRHSTMQEQRQRLREGIAAATGARRLLVLLLAVVVLLACLPAGANAGAYNPPLGEDARLDQIDDYPDWYEVDPLTLGARDYILDIRPDKGVRGIPKKMRVTLEPTGFVRLKDPSPIKAPSLFMGLWEPYTSMFKRTTTGFGMMFRRWKPDARQDMEYVFFKMDFRPPAFQPCCMSFKVGEIYDEMGERLGRFKCRLPHSKALIDPTFRAHRSWIKQRPW